jgi:hypothetical protein
MAKEIPRSDKDDALEERFLALANAQAIPLEQRRFSTFESRMPTF